MSQLLVLSTAILAVGPFTVTDTDIIGPDVIYPKAIIPGYEIVETDLPPNFNPPDWEWIAGQLEPKYVPPPQISQEQAKANYIAMMESRADVLQAEGKIVEALLLRESLK